MDALHDEKLKWLEEKATEIRIDIIKMLVEAGSGHSAGPLGMADVFTALYFHILNHNPKKPTWNDRDRVILSNGHIVPVWYATLAHCGYFPKKELVMLRKMSSMLQGHPHRGSAPGIENTSGPLGQGSSVAVGIAAAAKLKKQSFHTYLLISDGELDEGQSWEAFMYAGNHKLHNLTLICDRNNIQIDGNTENIQALEPLADKFAAFNWHVIEIDGHNMREIVDACAQAKSITERPVAIIAHTIPGKGVSYMENDFTWHGKPPGRGEEECVALEDLRALQKKIKGEHQ